MNIWGHRGAYSNAPENTLTAFQLAADLGADGIEFDVQLTKDNEVVVIHDEKLERVSDGGGFVKDHTLSELKKLNFNKRGVTEPLFMEIPTLREVLSLVRATALQLNIELKTGIFFYDGIERLVLREVERQNLLGRVIFSSFNHVSAERVKSLEPQAKIGFLCGGGIITSPEQCERAGAYALHPDVRALRLPGLVEDCRRRGVKVHAYTVTEPEDARFARENGVDAIIVNDILKFRRAFNDT
jgi:glycerophosphoryl diester phosphodiesterase